MLFILNIRNKLELVFVFFEKMGSAVKKLWSIAVLGMFLLTSCTTPVSQLKTESEKEAMGGHNSAWEAEQLANEDFTDFQDGTPIFTDLRGEVIRMDQVFNGAMELPENGDFGMSTGGYFQPVASEDEYGHELMVNQPTALASNLGEPGTYTIAAGCWGEGTAELKVFLGADYSDEDQEPSKVVSVLCSVPATVVEESLEVKEPDQYISLYLNGEPNTKGYYDFRISK